MSSPPPPPFLEAAAAEIEAHVGSTGWDRPPALFALVQVGQFAADEPDLARRLGMGAAAGDALTPIEQDQLPEGPLDEVLAQISWPDSVAGCALSQEIVLLPPSAEQELGAEPVLSTVAAHPHRRDARLVVAVTRDGRSAAVLRLRQTDGEDGLLTGPDLAPNLVTALLATLT